MDIVFVEVVIEPIIDTSLREAMVSMSCNVAGSIVWLGCAGEVEVDDALTEDDEVGTGSEVVIFPEDVGREVVRLAAGVEVSVFVVVELWAAENAEDEMVS